MKTPWRSWFKAFILENTENFEKYFRKMLSFSLKYIFYVSYIFSIALIVFEKFDKKVSNMKHCRALDAFLSNTTGETKRSYYFYLCYNISNFPHIYVFWHADYEYNIEKCRLADYRVSRKSDAYCTEMCYTSSNVSLISSKIIDPRKKCMSQKICIPMRSTNYIQKILRNFAY